MEKRQFLKSLSALGLFGIINKPAYKYDDETIHLLDPGIAFPAEEYKLPPLDYAFDALEPHIDAKTMEIHHDRHHNTYITNLNKELSTNTAAASKSLNQLFTTISKQSAAIRNNGGGHFNHAMFWKLLSPAGTSPSGELHAAITTSFKDLANLKDLMNKAGTGRFGSGWAWLVSDKKGKLTIGSTPNQDNPLMDVAEIKGFPILGIDVWEHAYYLKYQNKRADYLAAIWNVINWDEVNRRYMLAMGK